MSASARLSGARRTNRSLAKSLLPTTTPRPFAAPLSADGATATASILGLRLVCGQVCIGSIDARSVRRPPARLVVRSGVTCPPAPVVSTVLAQVSVTSCTS